MAAREDLQNKIAELDAITKALAEKKVLLENYRSTREQYVGLVQATKAELDQLQDTNAVKLQELRDALIAMYPTP